MCARAAGTKKKERKGHGRRNTLCMPSLLPVGSSCVINFEQGSLYQAGLGDISVRIISLAWFARAWGCAVVFPPPSEALDVAHNGGERIAEGVWWDRYHNMSAWSDVLDSLPGGRPRGHMSSWEDNVPSVEDMRAWLLAPSWESGELRVLSLHFRHTQDFWGAVHPMIDLLAQAGPFNEGLGRKPSQLAPSDLVVRSARQAEESLFAASGARWFSLHLRRGDYLASGAYPEGCADVPAVVWNVVHEKRRVELITASDIARVFVATDEGDDRYLSALRTGLESFFAAGVRMESEIPSRLLIPSDDFFTYRVVMLVFYSGVGVLDYRPNSMGNFVCDGRGRWDHPFPPLPPPHPTRPPPRPPGSPPWSPSPPARPGSDEPSAPPPLNPLLL